MCGVAVGVGVGVSTPSLVHLILPALYCPLAVPPPIDPGEWVSRVCW